MMDDLVPEGGRRDQPALGLEDEKGPVGPGPVGAARQLFVQGPELLFEIVVECRRRGP